MNVEGYTSSDEDETSRSEIERIERIGGGDSNGATLAEIGHLVAEIHEHPVSQSVKSKGTKRKRKETRKKQKFAKGQDPELLDYAGPWAHTDLSEYEEEDREPTEERQYFQPEAAETATTELFVLEKFLRDELERKKKDQLSFVVPTKVKAVLRGHTKGVTRVRFHCNSHVLLLSGNDAKIYLWSIETKLMLRGYYGHTQAVKDVVFSADGLKFLSAGVDRKIILWSTESGEILHEVVVSAIPNSVIFNPNNENEFVVGLLNRHIDHYDMSAPEPGKPVQSYDHHLGAINTLLAVDKNTKFMSTSDDRTIRFWKWQVNIPAKIIADPTQHATPHAAVHPTSNAILLQMMDNTVQTIQGSGKFKFNRAKSFHGHRVAGYGIQVAVLRDGEVVMSGDIGGNVFFWSWSSGKVMRKLKVSESYVSCVDVGECGVAAAGNSGDIYYCE